MNSSSGSQRIGFCNTNQAMLGVSQTVTQNNDLVEFEFIEIRWRKETNQVLYTPTLNGRRLNSFSMITYPSTGRMNPKVSFVDPANETLKKITYSLKAPHVLNIQLEGSTPSGENFNFDYDMYRQDCGVRL